MNVFLTGATGFIGSALLNRLIANKAIVTASVRSESVDLPNGVKRVVNDLTELNFEVSGLSPRSADEFNSEGDVSFPVDVLFSSMAQCDVVVHAAARAHILRDCVEHPLTEYRKVNRDATLALARLAANAGVRRFVFLSSIGVNGIVTTRPFTEYDTPKPVEPYAQSKWEAELGLWQIQSETRMEIVIIRPPLVYGLNAPGNFDSLVRWIDKGIPLPLGATYNKRSLVALENLVDLIITCVDDPAAANQVFLAGDGEDVSTTELLRAVAKAMGKPSRLIPVSAGLLMFGATLLGKRAVAQRLLGSLQVDISKTSEVLGWQPVVTMEQQLAKMFSDVEVDRFPPARE